MKKPPGVMFVFLLLIPFLGSAAQTTQCQKNKTAVAKSAATSTAWLDINELEALVFNDGEFAGVAPENTGGGLFYPKGQRDKALIYSSGLQVLGKMAGELRSAAVQYATEFQPGVILPDGTAADPTDTQYRVYKYNKGEAVDQAAIDQGCPQEVLGDQMLFSVFNDLGSHKNVYTLPPIGLEVQQTVWAYNRTDALGKTLFIRYRLINKNSDGKTLDSAYVAMWSDTDVGDGKDDYTGCDPTLGIAYAYNSTNNDQKYGAGAPAMACDFLQGPIVDAPGETAVLSDGTALANKKILGMTSYAFHL